MQQLERLRQQISEMRRVRGDWWGSQHAEEMFERMRAEQEAMKVQRQEEATAETGADQAKFRAESLERCGALGMMRRLCWRSWHPTMQT